MNSKPVLLLAWKDMEPKYAKWPTVLCWCDWAWRLLVVWLFWRLIKGGCWWSGRANFCCFLIRVSSRFEFQIGHSNFDKIYIFTFRYCKNKSLRLSDTVSLMNKNCEIYNGSTKNTFRTALPEKAQNNPHQIAIFNLTHVELKKDFIPV